MIERIGALRRRIRAVHLHARVVLAAVIVLGGDTSALAEISFNDRIAPIIHRHCSNCHRDGGVGPFPLLSFRDVASRMDQILDVVDSGYMPPWLPEPQPHAFDGERRLTPEEKRLLRVWRDEGMREGSGELVLPEFPSTWLLGKPDLELEIKDTFPMPAEGPDVFRNFVLRTDLTSSKYVTAFDFRPQPIAPIHHAVLQLDATGRSRQLAEDDPLPGFGGMENGRLTFGGFTRDPGGRLLGWLPGKIPAHEPQTAWALHPGVDIVFQLHLQAQGKPENVNGTVALYLTDTPPPKPTYTIFLSARDIDIPAGEKDYTVVRSYECPVEVDVHGIYPHAHFICRDMTVTATLPNGETTQLIKIRDWDFYWQDDYKYAKPFSLPAGTTIRMEYIFDNSSDNVRNPHQPPQRITWGEKSNDEMADLAILVVPKKVSDLGVLQKHFVESKLTEKLAEYHESLRASPDSIKLMTWIGEVEMLLNNPAKAIEAFDRVSEKTPGDPRLIIKNAIAHQAAGKTERAASLFASAAEMAPKDIDIQNAYADFLFRNGKLRESVALLQSLVKTNPNSFDAIMGLARIARQTGNPQKAIEFASRAVEVRSNSSDAWQFLGTLLMSQKRLMPAEQALRNAIRFDARNFVARLALGDLQLMQRKPKSAKQTFEALVKISPQNIVALNKLAVISAMQREWASAESFLQKALAAMPTDQMTLANLGRMLHKQNQITKALDAYAKAVDNENVSATTAQQYAWLLAVRDSATDSEVKKSLQWANYAKEKSNRPSALLLDTLAISLAANGKFEEAARTIAEAIELAKRDNPRQALEMISRRELFTNKTKYIAYSQETVSQ